MGSGGDSRWWPGVTGTDPELEPSGETESVLALLVDDRTDWATSIASRVEAYDASVKVVPVAAPSEAVALVESEPVDCVVADYRLSGMDVHVLLGRIDEADPAVRRLLITDEQGADVAAGAIEAGVTDHVMTDAAADHPAVFATRVRTAVRQGGSQGRGDQRYGPLVESNPDAIAVFDAEGLAYANERLTEMTGLDWEHLADERFLEDVVHPSDREQVASLLSVIEDEADDSVPDRLDVRLCRPDGSAVISAFECNLIEYGTSRALVCSIRDVTEWRRRQQRRARERTLRRAVQQSVVEASTRTDLETALSEHLVTEGDYECAWVGELTADSLRPRVVAGAEAYLDAVELRLDPEGDPEPSIRAAVTQEPQFASSIEQVGGHADDDWQAVATAHDYSAIASLPLVYNDVLYGVLSVYATASGFTDAERDLLVDLGGIFAYAIHSIETDAALLADRTIELGLRVTAAETYLADVIEQSPFDDDASISVLGTVPQSAETAIQFLTVTGGPGESVAEVFASHEDVQEVSVYAESGDKQRLECHVSGPIPESRLADLGAIVESVVVTPAGTEIIVEVPQSRDVESILETFEASFGPVATRWRRERDRPPQEDFLARRFDAASAVLGRADLTDKQQRALQTAQYRGYFEQPRESDAGDVAQTLDVARSTFLEHLRTAQRKVFESLFE